MGALWMAARAMLACHVMDRYFLDFGRLYKMQQCDTFFVAPAERNLNARHIYSAAKVRDAGTICDQSIATSDLYAFQNYHGYLRRTRFRDPETTKTPIFLTNNTVLPALTIAAPYTIANDHGSIYTRL